MEKEVKLSEWKGFLDVLDFEMNLSTPGGYPTLLCGVNDSLGMGEIKKRPGTGDGTDEGTDRHSCSGGPDRNAGVHCKSLVVSTAVVIITLVANIPYRVLRQFSRGNLSSAGFRVWTSRLFALQQNRLAGGLSHATPRRRDFAEWPRQYDTIFDRQRPHPTDKQRQDWLNLNRFLARLWQTDTAEFSLYGIFGHFARHVKANITTAPTIQTVALTSP
ncbi:hypothetical protein BV898_13868 [Hypsibius exemplaris]|uniref:Uncharacterized protein n=1 Tax=Hypsibius exemplaris TaxID=2072580 RepID=A0A1W0W9I3_HYPEX|nr:hypothetical protein BV898_13868 [Hypsibius exemplaris]